ncbi:MAG TPA: asparagine synthase (glutamine-hydrolyzing) [Ohtaekwangia sp.]
MCGITAIVTKRELASEALIKANTIVSHRGPDDEGYLLWAPGNNIQVLAGKDTAESTRQYFQYPSIATGDSRWKVGLGHRRLSILDLSPHGHQPMVLSSHGLVITFNGEIFNYIEVRDELRKLGHHFQTESDTEVILHAWAHWGSDSLHRFNGMFAFVLLDTIEQKIYAVRDRFGVKPLYFTATASYTAFASEIKQLRTLPESTFVLNERIAFEYLHHGLLDHDFDTFEKGIYQVMPGTLLELDINTGDVNQITWYTLKPARWNGTEAEACSRFYALLKDSVRLRMRSDVPVGSALSGGLDSSTVVCLMRSVLQDQGAGDNEIKTITSCYEDKKYDEWEFAEVIVNHVKARSFKVFPTFEKLQQDFEKMMWHMDYPFGSTSQFSQWCVFEGAKQQGLTVMIDGQGADEQLAGYGGNETPLYSGLLRKGKVLQIMREAHSYKQQNGKFPVGSLLGALQTTFPGIVSWFPENYQSIKKNHQSPSWLNASSYRSIERTPLSLQDTLTQQIQRLPLPSLLRYEDRNSMAFSIESRVPFMDYRLIEFTLGLPENLIFRKGTKKYILRKAFRGHVPDKILDRRDKMGFVSAEERWMKSDGADWFQRQIDQSIQRNPVFFKANETGLFYNQMITGKSAFNFEPWRIICFNAFLKQHNG